MVNKNLSQPEAQSLSQEPPKPPFPKVFYRVLNPLMAALLRSPLHGWLSHSMLLLSFHGRKSGKGYTLPLGYVQQHDRIFVLTHSPWWKNLRGGAPVLMRLQGRNVGGTARIVEESALIGDVMQAFVKAHGPKMAQRIGLVDEQGNVVESPPPGTTFIAIDKEQYS
ncbi:MAG TPA: nitroreductase/quinone reductase family protein [Herpetosiphonaceae bacterium]